jgi:hypothetical protein
VTAPDKETSIFDGIDTSYAGLFKTLGLTAPAGVDSALAAIDAAVDRAVSTFKFTDPASAVPALTEGLRVTREVMAKSGDEPGPARAEVKERQFQDAISAALGVELSAFADPSPKPPASDSAGRGGGRGNISTMTAPIPGQTFGINVRFTNRGTIPVQLESALMMPTPGYTPTVVSGQVSTLGEQQSGTFFFAVKVADDAPISTKPYFSRAAFTENRYTLSDPSIFGRPFNAAPLVALANYTVNGVAVQTMDVVKRREPNLPYGFVVREVRTVPRIALTVGGRGDYNTRYGGTVNPRLGLVANATASTTLKLAPHGVANGLDIDAATTHIRVSRAGSATYRFKVTQRRSIRVSD